MIKSVNSEKYLMGRYIVYFAVALLAFGIGFKFVHEADFQNAETASKAFSRADGGKLHLQLPDQSQTIANSKASDFLTDRKKSILLFQPTLDKWLNIQKMDETVEPSPETLENIQNAGLNSVEETGLIAAAQKSYKPFLIDLNGDGKNELAILSNCSRPEHCELWVFERSKEDFEIILSTYTEVENFSLRKSKKNGYFDIETTHAYTKSETSLGMAIYEFDGERYIKTECFDYIYLYRDPDGNLQKLKKPKFISLHCC